MTVHAPTGRRWVWHISFRCCRSASRSEWLNAGEIRVARALADLDDGWTVYVQPRLGMDIPDFVALHDRYGVCAIEVKDWAYGKYRNTAGVVELRDRGGWRAVDQHPRLQASRYRSSIFENSFALPEDGQLVPPSVRGSSFCSITQRSRRTKSSDEPEGLPAHKLPCGVRSSSTRPKGLSSAMRLRRHLLSRCSSCAQHSTALRTCHGSSRRSRSAKVHPTSQRTPTGRRFAESGDRRGAGSRTASQLECGSACRGRGQVGSRCSRTTSRWRTTCGSSLLDTVLPPGRTRLG